MHGWFNETFNGTLPIPSHREITVQDIVAVNAVRLYENIKLEGLGYVVIRYVKPLALEEVTSLSIFGNLHLNDVRDDCFLPIRTKRGSNSIFANLKSSHCHGYK